MYSEASVTHLEYQEFVVVGRVSKPFGLKGWSRITSFTEPPESILSYRPWALAKVSESESVQDWDNLENLQTKSQSGGFFARIGECRTRSDAELITGRLIGVQRTTLPNLKQDEHYWFDLLGTKVVNLRGQALGHVDEVFDSGAHSILRIGTDNEDVLIPIVPQVTRDIRPGEQILVDWELDW
jgi:16S rRNA processing protein RimM